MVFASAAALTLGRYTVPVYEVYKVGADPEWADGLDLLPAIGPDVAVIPHYDNAEGRHPRHPLLLPGRAPPGRCWRRSCPTAGGSSGVDEHTGCIFDLDAGTASVVGNGVVTVRRAGRSEVVGSGETIPIGALVELASGKRAAGVPLPPPPAPAADAAPTALHAEIRRLEARIRHGGRGTRRRRRGAGRPGAGRHPGGMVGRHHPVRRRRPGPGGCCAAWSPGSASWPAPVPATRARWSAASWTPCWRPGRRPGRTGRYDEADRLRDRLLALGVEVRDTPTAQCGTSSPAAELLATRTAARRRAATPTSTGTKWELKAGG